MLRLKERLELAYAGRPVNAPTDRAFTAMIEAYEMPRTLPEALLEGLAWDAMERNYANLSELFDYSARVASSVGAMMSVLMGVRDQHALARACDLGVAMQLTNIARDVGEDARERRMYLPLDWLEAAGIEPEAFFRDPVPSAPVRRMVQKLLAEASRLYVRGEAGISALPASCRTGIYAARHIYSGIGADVGRAGFDSISRRARTNTRQKIGWLMLSGFNAGVSTIMPGSAVLYAPPLREVKFLVDAAAHKPSVEANQWGEGRAGDLVALFAALKAKDIQREGALETSPS